MSVIKVARNRREIHLGGNKVSGEHFVWCKVNTFEVKTELFSWMSADTGRRHTGEPQVMSVILIRLLHLMLCSLFTLAVCRIDNEHKFTSTQCTVIKSVLHFVFFLKKIQMLNSTVKDVAWICLGMTKLQGLSRP